MRLAQPNAFSRGKILAQHPSNSNFYILYDGFTSIIALATIKPRIGYWYDVYYNSGHYWIGAELPIDNN